MEQTSPKKTDILPVTDLISKRDDILQKNIKDLPVVRFDPRPPDYCQLTSEAIEKFRCDLLSLNQTSAFLKKINMITAICSYMYQQWRPDKSVMSYSS